MFYLMPVSFQPAFGLSSPAAQQAIAQSRKQTSTNKPQTLRQLGTVFSENFVTDLPYTLGGILLGDLVRGLVKSKRSFYSLLGALVGGSVAEGLRRQEKQKMDSFLHKKTT